MELDTALAFVADRKHGVLTTLKADGRPQLSNILYHVGDDGVIRISVTDGRAKTANLRRDPRASLHVTRDDFYAYVVIEATRRAVGDRGAARRRRRRGARRARTARRPASTRTGTTSAGRWSPTAASSCASTRSGPTACSGCRRDRSAAPIRSTKLSW